MRCSASCACCPWKENASNFRGGTDISQIHGRRGTRLVILPYNGQAYYLAAYAHLSSPLQDHPGDTVRRSEDTRWRPSEPGFKESQVCRPSKTRQKKRKKHLSLGFNVSREASHYDNRKLFKYDTPQSSWQRKFQRASTPKKA